MTILPPIIITLGLLCTVTSSASTSGGGGGGGAGLDVELKSLVEKAKNVLKNHQEQQQEQKSMNEATTKKDDNKNNNNNNVDNFVKLTKEISQTYKQLARAEKQMDKLMEIANVKQMKLFAKKLHELVRQEEERRKKLAAKDSSSEELGTKGYLSIERLDEIFSPETLLLAIERDMEKFVNGILETEIDSIANEAIESYRKTRKSRSTAEDNDECLTPAAAAQEVQAALLEYSKDGIGEEDHCLAGATIVHEMTSKTFSGTSISYAGDEENDESAIGAAPVPTFGTAWWSKYIPDDVEDLLPAGWQNWPVPSIPNSWLHTLGFPTMADVASPEAILHPNTSPGSCWPMVGSSGNITIRLPYTVAVSSITIDHVSPLNVVHHETTLQSAPKNIRVYGYGPCDGVCDGLGFDLTSKSILTDSVLYDIKTRDKSATQTFSVSPKALSNDAKDDSYVNEFEDDAEGCSPLKPLCHRHEVVAAVQLEIVDNWGNEDFTCMYRVRVHGDPV